MPFVKSGPLALVHERSERAELWRNYRCRGEGISERIQRLQSVACNAQYHLVVGMQVALPRERHCGRRRHAS